MLNIVTVHWQSKKWIEPQLRYLERNIDQPFRVFASLNGIAEPEIRDRFHYAADLEGTHAEKLNALAETVMERSDPSDLLLFVDGDAFPIEPIGAWMERTLEIVPLAAVRRDENLGDRQPHPCFCFTTCRFWASIRGDWREGGTWVNSAGETTTDVGGNLLHQLADRGTGWLPLLRTNTYNPEPLWFGIYEHRIYHHGAGFRERKSRITYHAEALSHHDGHWGRSLEGLIASVARRPTNLSRIRPKDLGKLRSAMLVSWDKERRRRRDRRRLRLARRAEALADEVYESLLSDPMFYRRFDATISGGFSKSRSIWRFERFRKRPRSHASHERHPGQPT